MGQQPEKRDLLSKIVNWTLGVLIAGAVISVLVVMGMSHMDETDAEWQQYNPH